MELWVFDRLGAYSSGPFDIHDEPETFARAFVSYATMDDDAMDTFIERGDETNSETKMDRHVTLDDADGNETRIKLAQAIVRQKAVVCRGTTCFETENNQETGTRRQVLLGIGQAEVGGGAAEASRREGRQRGGEGCSASPDHHHQLREGLEFRKRH